MIVTGIERQKKHPDRYSIFVEGEFAVGVSSEVLLSEGLRKGDEVTGDRLEELRNREELSSARRIAARYLASRRRTEWEIRRRLASKEFPARVIDRIAGELLASGQINDREFILAFIHDAQLRTPSGPRMLTAKLRRKGLGSEMIAEVLPAALPADEETELALKSARGYVTKIRRREQAGKLYPPGKIRGLLRGYLAGRGFGQTAIRTAMKGVLRDAEERGGHDVGPGL